MWACPLGSPLDIPSSGGTLSTRADVKFKLSHPWPITPLYYHWQNLSKSIQLVAMRQGVRESGTKLPKTPFLLTANEGWQGAYSLGDKFDPL